MRLSERIPFKTCANPQARNQNINRANAYENRMVQADRDLNCSGASPILADRRKNSGKGFFFLFPTFLKFAGAVLGPSGEGRKRQKKGEEGRLWPIPGREGRHPLSPHLLHPNVWQPESVVGARYALL